MRDSLNTLSTRESLFENQLCRIRRILIFMLPEYLSFLEIIPDIVQFEQGLSLELKVIPMPLIKMTRHVGIQ